MLFYIKIAFANLMLFCKNLKILFECKSVNYMQKNKGMYFENYTYIMVTIIM